ncbi:MAG TPA: methyltransferase domain-containing protein [Stellaceae bacterium]|jgi:SAM-dependent methyltransferase
MNGAGKGPPASRPPFPPADPGETPAVLVADRLLSLLDHLGIVRAHVATQIPGDIAGVVAAHPERIGGIVLCAPVRLDPEPFLGVEGRVLMIAGEYGPTETVTTRAWSRLPNAERLLLDNYEAQGWSDVVRDCTGEIAGQMTAFLGKFPADAPKVAGEGSHAGISYRIEGSGPALILAPFFLAPTQWDAAVPALGERFTVIRLGGAHLGGVAALEDRAAMPTYRAMFRSVVDLLAPQPGETILDVGSGAGSLDRLLAQWTAGANKITTVDASPYLLREAAALATAEGLSIDFTPGNAEALPFPDASFDCVFSVTVFEECDADKAIAEMVRVARPGGRIGVVVRAIDLPQWWHLDLPDAIRVKVTPPPQSVARGGVADKSLYRRMKRAGLADLVCFPFLLTLDRPEGPIWRYREDHVLALLDPDERQAWLDARAMAEADGLLMMANPLHCGVGRKA